MDEQPLIEFNNLAHKFLSVMEKTFPDEEKISAYKLVFQAIRLSDNKKPVEMFMENLSYFGLQIMSKDEKFFKQDQYIHNMENISGKIGLVQYWDTINNSTKEAIWEYIQSLYALGMLALNRTEEFQQIIQMVNQ